MLLTLMSSSHDTVAPRRGAWIEMYNTARYLVNDKVAPRRGAWIEISKEGAPP